MRVKFLIVVCLCGFALMVAPTKGTRPGAPKPQAVGSQNIENPLSNLVGIGTVKDVSVVDGKKLVEVEMQSDSGPITLWIGTDEEGLEGGGTCLVKWIERSFGAGGPRRVLAVFKEVEK